MEGWIKIYRAMLTHWIWKDSAYLKAWVYILARANFSNTNVLIDKVLMPVGRGEFITSLKKLSDDAGMTIQRTRTFLKLLETDQMVKLETTSKLTKITICNYDNYQDQQHSVNTVSTQSQHSANTVPTTDKKEKKENNEEKYSFDSFWNAFSKKTDKTKCINKWSKLTEEEKKLAMDVVLEYVKSTPDVSFRKNPLTWLNGRCWEDDIIYQNCKPKQHQPEQQQQPKNPKIITQTNYDGFKFE